MRSNRALLSPVRAAVALATVTGGLLAAVDWLGVDRAVGPVLVVLSGMTAMSALSALIQATQGAPRTASIDFDPEFVAMAIAKVAVRPNAGFAARVVPTPEDHSNQTADWDITALRLVGVDNSLALAKLRIDLERELRRLAARASIDISERPLGVAQLARELQGRGVLPETLYYSVRQVGEVASRAVHGEPINDDQARGVVSVGTQLLDALAHFKVSAPSSGAPAA